MRLVLLALTAVTFLIHGYHPLAEDGGLYLAGIEHQLDPNLFPQYTAFVTEHLRFSLFVPSIVALIHITRLPFAWAILMVDLFTLWLTFYAAHKLLARCIAGDIAQLAGLCLLSALWTLPIAGTSLLLMDPYLTARSLSTPFSLLAIACALDPWDRRPRPVLACLLALLAAALFHPLMAAYALAFVTTLRVVRSRHRLLFSALLLLVGLALAATLQALAPPESPALIAAESTRYYWFLSQWHWYELLGLAAPLAIFAAYLVCMRDRHAPPNHNIRILCRASLTLGLIAIAVAALFAHRDAFTHLVARLQPLRLFLLLYAVMVLPLGATLTQRALESQRAFRGLAALTVLLIAAAMFTVQRLTFPSSPHLELPTTTSANPWTRAFLWARDNTPRNALFALDARYINQPGEDAQTFRATALRSALPDYSKDGGEAAITPSLAPLWQPAAAAQSGLSTLPDTIRDARLQPFHATWMVLQARAVTLHPCPYDNGIVKVCKPD